MQCSMAAPIADIHPSACNDHKLPAKLQYPRIVVSQMPPIPLVPGSYPVQAIDQLTVFEPLFAGSHAPLLLRGLPVAPCDGLVEELVDAVDDVGPHQGEAAEAAAVDHPDGQRRAVHLLRTVTEEYNRDPSAADIATGPGYISLLRSSL